MQMLQNCRFYKGFRALHNQSTKTQYHFSVFTINLKSWSDPEKFKLIKRLPREVDCAERNLSIYFR